MLIELNDTTTIRHIQEQFSGKYPYLEINFFIHHPGANQLYHKKDLVAVDKTISDIKKTHISALMEINPWNTVADVEKEFYQRFGLRVQVLRNCYGHWILPEGADNLTLMEQNEIGKNQADPVIHPDLQAKVEDTRYN